MSNVHVVEQLLVPPGPDVKMETEHILAMQFRSLVRGLNMTPEKWEELMDRMIARHELSHLADPEQKKSIRSNLEREFLQPSMTWKVFCKGLEFLNVKHAVVFTNVMTHDGLSASTAMNVGYSE